ncbi:hypothetical protein [Streptomyces nymphaeiformis]|jgi:hypothetical protein|uniref:Uncharacterized protein n=1 Tax=Streptomyces nymphaeiformis TaxID=2663842 RepID=A0A7W7U9H2_9ACTN|nr:hypothetical protein [Streptomyces nymphaeiformis]MBB4987502.1 hypothetical protein [Streptomyces nymphaeiformis]
MPAYPNFDPAGVAYDLHLWHPEWGSVHVSVGTPSYPTGVFNNAGVDAIIQQLAQDLLAPIGGEKVIEVVRLQTESVKWTPPAPPTP